MIYVYIVIYRNLDKPRYINLNHKMSIPNIYQDLIYPVVVIPIISISISIVMGILGIFYNQGLVIYPPEMVIIVTVLFCIVAKIVWSWEHIWVSLGAIVAPSFATMGSTNGAGMVDRDAMIRE